MTISAAGAAGLLQRQPGAGNRLPLPPRFSSSSQPSRRAHIIRGSACGGADRFLRSALPAFRHRSPYSSVPALLPDDGPDTGQFQRLQHLHGALPLRHAGAPQDCRPRPSGLVAGDLRRHFAAGHLLIGWLRRSAAGSCSCAPQPHSSRHRVIIGTHFTMRTPFSLRYSRISRMAAGRPCRCILRRHAVGRQLLLRQIPGPAVEPRPGSSRLHRARHPVPAGRR